jgi:hypothetical protein
MIRIPKVTMTMRELDRLKCIQGLIDGQLKQHAVAARLGLTTRLIGAYFFQASADTWKLTKRVDKIATEYRFTNVGVHKCVTADIQ